MKKAKFYSTNIIAVILLSVTVVCTFAGCILTEKSQQRNFSECLENSIKAFKKENKQIIIEIYQNANDSNPSAVLYEQRFVKKAVDNNSGDVAWHAFENGKEYLYPPQKYWESDKRPRWYLYERTMDKFSTSLLLDYNIDKIRDHIDWFQYDKESNYYISKDEFQVDLSENTFKAFVKIKFTKGLISEYVYKDIIHDENKEKTIKVVFKYNQNFELSLPQYEEEY